MTVCWIDRAGPSLRPGPSLGPVRPVRPLLAVVAVRADRPMRPAPSRLTRVTRRVAVALVGTLAVLAGVAMLVLPGPGLVTIALGFGILGREYTWAARVSDAIRARLAATADGVRRAVRRP